MSQFRVFADEEGGVAAGWIEPGILYARYVNGLSASLGIAFANHLQTLVVQAESVRFFGDASALKHYDLLARSAFARVVLGNRRAFSSIVMLTWAAGIGPAARAFAAVFAETRVSILEDAGEFESRLLREAPSARRVLERNRWDSTANGAKTSRTT